MARTTNKNRKLDRKIEEEIYRDLLKELKNLNSRTDLDNFFKFMTEDEKTLFFRRLAVIKFINTGKKYKEIKEILNISDNTISNVMDILKGRGYGRNPNRKRVYSEIKNHRKNKKKPKKLFSSYKGAESII